MGEHCTGYRSRVTLVMVAGCTVFGSPRPCHCRWVVWKPPTPRLCVIVCVIVQDRITKHIVQGFLRQESRFLPVAQRSVGEQEASSDVDGRSELLLPLPG